MDQFTYIRQQFEAQGFFVFDVLYSRRDEQLVVYTRYNVYTMAIGGDDDCYLFSDDSGNSVTFPFEPEN